MLILPTFTDATAYRYTVALDGRDYLLRFVFDERYNTWHLDLSLPDGTPLAQGVRVVSGIPLLRHYHDAEDRLPKGALVALDLGKTPTEPGRDISRNHRLIYFSAKELAELETPESGLSISFEEALP